MIDNFLPAKAQHAINTLTTETSKSLDSKVGQQIDARISSINQQKTAIQLSIGNKRTDVVIHNETAASNQQAKQLQVGQDIKLVMTKSQPHAEYKMLIANQEQKNSPTFKVATQNNSINTPANLQTSANVKNPLLSKLALDQKITATVLSNDKNLTLKLFTPKAITLEFPKSNLAKATNNISLQVIKAGDQPQFKILPAPTEEESITTALKELLPKEQSSAAMLNQLVKSLAKNESVPDKLKRLAQDILRNLPTKQQLTEGTQLKKNVDNSGLFLEAKLANGKQATNIAPDLKAKITQLVAALQQESGATDKSNPLQELQTKSESALARLVLNQLKSLPQDEANRQVWTVELPFVDKKQAKSLQIQIEEENNKHAESADHKSWSATLNLSPPNLSTVHCKISYFNNTVHTNFWSEEGETTQLIQGNLDYLAQRLEALGLTPGNLNSRQKTDTTSAFDTPKTTKPLFNNQA